MSVAKTLRERLNASLVSIAERTEPVAERCIILSGGVDTCAILAAAEQTGVKFGGAITVLTGEDSPDREFAIAVATSAGLKHDIVYVTAADLVSIYLPDCVKALATFDGMTLRNSLVVAAAMRKAKELGFRSAIVGDGADELFGGYSFTWGMEDDPAGWKDKRDKLCAKWTFATAKLAEMFGLTSHSPYTEPSFVEWAVENTVRADCIKTRPIKLTLGGEAIEHVAGKMCLREAYDTVSSWRRKDPIEVGSGITVIGHDPFWSDLIADKEFEDARADLKAQGIDIKNKEHLANFRCFEEAGFLHSHPWIVRLDLGRGCAGCCFDIGDAMWCSVCGAYPAQRAAAS